MKLYQRGIAEGGRSSEDGDGGGGAAQCRSSRADWPQVGPSRHVAWLARGAQFGQILTLSLIDQEHNAKLVGFTNEYSYFTTEPGIFSFWHERQN